MYFHLVEFRRTRNTFRNVILRSVFIRVLIVDQLKGTYFVCTASNKAFNASSFVPTSTKRIFCMKAIPLFLTVTQKVFSNFSEDFSALSSFQFLSLTCLRDKHEGKNICMMDHSTFFYHSWRKFSPCVVSFI